MKTVTLPMGGSCIGIVHPDMYADFLGLIADGGKDAIMLAIQQEIRVKLRKNFTRRKHRGITYIRSLQAQCAIIGHARGYNIKPVCQYCGVLMPM